MPETVVLSPEEIAHFEDQGYVRVTEAFAPNAALAMLDFMWQQLETQSGIKRDDRTTWSLYDGKLNKTAENPVYRPIAGPRMCGAIDQLLGVGTWRVPKSWGGFLVTFPSLAPEPWQLRADQWHWDGNVWGNLETLNGLFIFTFFSSVKPAGGGTLALAGSPALLNQFLRTLNSHDSPSHGDLIKRFTRSHPWLAELTGKSSEGTNRVERFMAPTEIEGLSQRAIELTGEPGDAILCHPSILHTTSMNCAEVPRFMRVKGLVKNAE